MDFEGLYKTYFRPVSGFFRRRGHSAEKARDLTQETFLGIYRGWETYEDQNKVGAWVFRSAMNVHLKVLRARNTHKRRGEEVSTEALDVRDPGFLSSPAVQDSQAIGDELCDRVWSEILRLMPEIRRLCLLLRLQGLSYKAIGQTLELPFETVKSHLRRARETLDARLRQVDLEGVSLGDLAARLLDRLATQAEGAEVRDAARAALSLGQAAP